MTRYKASPADIMELRRIRDFIMDMHTRSIAEKKPLDLGCPPIHNRIEDVCKEMESHPDGVVA